MRKPKAKPTKYSGVLFRSRLEADWARCFDDLLVPWTYEPQAFRIDTYRTYTPDFVLSSRGEIVVVEIKPTLEEMQQDDRVRALSRIGKKHWRYLAVAGTPGSHFVWEAVGGRRMPAFSHQDIEEALAFYP